MKNINLILGILFITHIAAAQETVTFPSSDGLTITADQYLNEDNTEFILLCHQAGYSRGEYIETAPVLLELGYNCMAIDQRSGNQVNGVINETAAAASALNLGQGFLDAIPDIETAIDVAFELNGNQPIYLFGSSYSSSLALVLGKDNPKVKASIAFSPGEYLSGINVGETISSYDKPIFVTSSQLEIPVVTSLVADVDPEFLTHFQPTVAGVHGSRSLWNSTAGNEQYWEALILFLSSPSGIVSLFTVDFNVYPNPSNGVINIEAEHLLRIEIIDMLGKVVLQSVEADKIDLSNYEKGTYFIKIYTDQGIGISHIILE